MVRKLGLLFGIPLLLSAGPAAVPGSREAASRAEWSARTRHVVNRRFTFAEFHPRAKGSLTLLLAETFDRSFDTQAEGEKSSTTVEAFAIPGDAKLPVWRFQTEGAEGAPDGELYRVTHPGCCGAQNLDVFFSLHDGHELFASDGPILKLEVPNTAERRYVGYHSLMAATPIPEAGARKGVIGVLTYGSDRAPAARLLVVGSNVAAPDDYARKGLAFVRNGKPVDEPILELWSAGKANGRAAIGGFSIRVTDYAKNDFLLEIPVAGDRFDTARVKTAPGVSVREMP
jgi:hypothetical protein